MQSKKVSDIRVVSSCNVNSFRLFLTSDIRRVSSSIVEYRRVSSSDQVDLIIIKVKYQIKFQFERRLEKWICGWRLLRLGNLVSD